MVFTQYLNHCHFADVTEDAGSFAASQQDTLDSFFVKGENTPISPPQKETAQESPSSSSQAVNLANGIVSAKKEARNATSRSDAEDEGSENGIENTVQETPEHPVKSEPAAKLIPNGIASHLVVQGHSQVIIFT